MSFYPAKGGGKSKSKYLYNYGDECSENSGGWVSYNDLTSSGTNIKSITKNSNNLRINAGNGQFVCAGTAKKVDFTDVDFMCVKYQKNGSDSEEPLVTIRDTVSGDVWQNRLSATASGSSQNEMIIDTRSLTGSHYVTVSCNNGRGIYLYLVALLSSK